MRAGVGDLRLERIERAQLLSRERISMDHTGKSYRWWVIFLLFCGTFVNAVDRGSLGVAAPSIMKELHLNPAMMGVVLSAFFWTYFAMNIPSGALADRFGAKATLGWAAFVWSFLSALTGAAHNFVHWSSSESGWEPARRLCSRATSKW